MTGLEYGAKVKHVRRAISVLEYFAMESKTASVMDIVRRFGFPQSSVCELLGVLVETGILTRCSETKAYSATPRLAALGLATQPPGIADGSLFRLIEDLSNDWGVVVGLFGISGTSVQVQSLSHAGADDQSRAESSRAKKDFALGTTLPLSRSSIGMLLLSTMGAEQYDRILWRLLSEATKDKKFDYSSTCQKVRSLEASGWGSGDAGFVRGWGATSVLLPKAYGDQALAIASLYPKMKSFNARAFSQALQKAIAEWAPTPEQDAEVSGGPDENSQERELQVV